MKFIFATAVLAQITVNTNAFSFISPTTTNQNKKSATPTTTTRRPPHRTNLVIDNDWTRKEAQRDWAMIEADAESKVEHTVEAHTTFIDNLEKTAEAVVIYGDGKQRNIPKTVTVNEAIISSAATSSSSLASSQNHFYLDSSSSRRRGPMSQNIRPSGYQASRHRTKLYAGLKFNGQDCESNGDGSKSDRDYEKEAERQVIDEVERNVERLVEGVSSDFYSPMRRDVEYQSTSSSLFLSSTSELDVSHTIIEQHDESVIMEQFSVDIETSREIELVEETADGFSSSSTLFSSSTMKVDTIKVNGEPIGNIANDEYTYQSNNQVDITPTAPRTLESFNVPNTVAKVHHVETMQHTPIEPKVYKPFTPLPRVEAYDGNYLNALSNNNDSSKLDVLSGKGLPSGYLTDLDATNAKAVSGQGFAGYLDRLPTVDPSRSSTTTSIPRHNYGGTSADAKKPNDDEDDEQNFGRYHDIVQNSTRSRQQPKYGSTSVGRNTITSSTPSHNYGGTSTDAKTGGRTPSSAALEESVRKISEPSQHYTEDEIKKSDEVKNESITHTFAGDVERMIASEVKQKLDSEAPKFNVKAKGKTTVVGQKSDLDTNSVETQTTSANKKSDKLIIDRVISCEDEIKKSDEVKNESITHTFAGDVERMIASEVKQKLDSEAPRVNVKAKGKTTVVGQKSDLDTNSVETQTTSANKKSDKLIIDRVISGDNVASVINCHAAEVEIRQKSESKVIQAAEIKVEGPAEVRAEETIESQVQTLTERANMEVPKSVQVEFAMDAKRKEDKNIVMDTVLQSRSIEETDGKINTLERTDATIVQFNDSFKDMEMNDVELQMRQRKMTWMKENENGNENMNKGSLPFFGLEYPKAVEGFKAPTKIQQNLSKRMKDVTTKKAMNVTATALSKAKAAVEKAKAIADAKAKSATEARSKALSAKNISDDTNADEEIPKSKIKEARDSQDRVQIIDMEDTQKDKKALQEQRDMAYKIARLAQDQKRVALQIAKEKESLRAERIKVLSDAAALEAEAAEIISASKAIETEEHSKLNEIINDLSREAADEAEKEIAEWMRGKKEAIDVVTALKKKSEAETKARAVAKAIFRARTIQNTLTDTPQQVSRIMDSFLTPKNSFLNTEKTEKDNEFSIDPIQDPAKANTGIIKDGIVSAKSANQKSVQKVEKKTKKQTETNIISESTPAFVEKQESKNIRATPAVEKQGISKGGFFGSVFGTNRDESSKKGPIELKSPIQSVHKDVDLEQATYVESSEPVSDSNDNLKEIESLGSMFEAMFVSKDSVKKNTSQPTTGNKVDVSNVANDFKLSTFVENKKTSEDVPQKGKPTDSSWASFFNPSKSSKVVDETLTSTALKDTKQKAEAPESLKSPTTSEDKATVKKDCDVTDDNELTDPVSDAFAAFFGTKLPSRTTNNKNVETSSVHKNVPTSRTTSTAAKSPPQVKRNNRSKGGTFSHFKFSPSGKSISDGTLNIMSEEARQLREEVSSLLEKEAASKKKSRGKDATITLIKRNGGGGGGFFRDSSNSNNKNDGSKQKFEARSQQAVAEKPSTTSMSFKKQLSLTKTKATKHATVSAASLSKPIKRMIKPLTKTFVVGNAATRGTTTSTTASGSSSSSSSSSIKNDSIPILTDWKQNVDGTITGNISNSNIFKTGQKVITSPVENGVEEGFVTTVSGSKYRLL